MAKEALEDRDVVRNAIQAMGPDGLLHTLATVLHEYMETEVSGRRAAEYGERIESRENLRNGYRERPLETRMGSEQLRIPKLRSGSY